MSSHRATRWQEEPTWDLNKTDLVQTPTSPLKGLEVSGKSLNLLLQTKPKNGTYLIGWLCRPNKYTLHQAKPSKWQRLNFSVSYYC